MIPSGFIPAVEKGVREAMQQGVVAGYPLRDVRVTLYDGSYHSVDSSEMAFKIAGSMAFKKAAEQAQPTLLEPIMQVAVVVPEDAVGDVIGDLNGRRGRPLGMEPKGSMTEIKAEVPMAEMLNYAPDLRSITGGRGEYTMEFAALRGGSGAPGAEGDLRGRPGGRGGGKGLKHEGQTYQPGSTEDHVACDVCGRTMLKGERAEPYLTPSRERRLVCQLCAPRAQQEGWIREAAAPEMPARPQRQPDRRGLLRRRRSAAKPDEEPAAPCRPTPPRRAAWWSASTSTTTRSRAGCWASRSRPRSPRHVRPCRRTRS